MMSSFFMKLITVCVFLLSLSLTAWHSDSHIGDSNEDAGWTCDLCTFQNKYTQRSCEACTMPFLSAGNQMGYSNNGTFVQPSPVYMPMHSLPYHPNNNNINNNNNMPYLYYQPTSMPPMHPPSQFYSSSLPDPQSMYSRFWLIGDRIE